MQIIRLSRLSGLVLILLLSALALAEDQEVKINRKGLPAAVLSAFQQAYPDAKITAAALETENNQEYYEISCKERGVKRDVLYTADGRLVSVEERIKPGDLPSFVREAVAKRYAQGTITEAEQITQDNKTSYEVLLRQGDKYFELSLAADGSITGTEEKTGKDED